MLYSNEVVFNYFDYALTLVKTFEKSPNVCVCVYNLYIA